MASLEVRDDLWLGILAVQIGLVTPETVLAAAQSTRESSDSLGDVLVRLHALTPDEHALLQRLRDRLTARNLPLEPGGWSIVLEAALKDAAGRRADPAAVSSSVVPDTVELSQQPTPDPYATADLGSGTGSTSLAPPSGGNVPPSSPSRFRVIRLHARGGLGQVSLAIDQELRREVALKEIQGRYADDENSRSRFIREAEITGSLEHPGIVPVYGLGVSEQGRPYYAMRFIQGRSLDEAIKDFYQLPKDKTSDRKLQFRELLRRFIDVCNAVEYAHSRGVVHRDLKPANVMLGPYGETLVVDWGLAKSRNENGPEPSKASASGLSSSESLETQHGSALGTPQYMSPEQAAGDWSAVGPRSDVYSLGATLYHLLTGKASLGAGSVSELLSRVRQGQFLPPRAVLATVAPPLEGICLRAMAREPADRYASAHELAAEIEHWLADEPVTAYQEGPLERWYRRLRRHRSWTMAIGTVLPLLLIVSTSAAIFVDRARREALFQRDVSDHAKKAETVQRKLAEANAERARVEEQKARQANEESRRTLINLFLASGERSQSEGDPGAAALWFSKALPLLAAQDSAAEQLHRIRLGILLRSLSRPAALWALPPAQRRLVVQSFVSSDAKRVLFTGASREVVGVDALTGKPLWPPLAHSDFISWAGFSSDNRRIITLCQKRQVRIWDAETGKPVSATLTTANDIPWGGSGADGQAELSRDGQLLVVITAPTVGRAVEVWNVTSGKAQFPPLQFADKVSAAAFSPDGKQLLGGTDSKVQFYDSTTGKPDGSPIPAPALWRAGFSPNGNWLFTCSGDGSAQIWDAKTRQAAGPALAHRGPVTQAVFSPDSKWLLTLSSDRTARIWDVASGKAIGAPLEHSDRPFSGRFSPDGRRVVTVTLDNTVRLWDVQTGRLLAAPWHHAAFPEAIATENHVLIFCAGRGIPWDVSRSAEMGSLRVQGADAVKHLAYAPDNKWVAAAEDRRLWLIDSLSGATKVGPLKYDANLQTLAVSQDSQWLATGHADGSVRLWKTADGSLAPAQIKHQQAVTQVGFDSQSKRLLTCSDDKTARIWNVETGEQVGAPLEHAASVTDGEFSPDGRWVITGCNDGAARIWNATDGKLHAEPKTIDSSQPPQEINRVGFDPLGKAAFAAGNRDETIVWLPFQVQPDLQRFRLGASARNASFSPNGQFLLVSGLTNVARLWDWQDKNQPAVLFSAGTVALDAEFHPSSKFLALTSFSGLELWESATGRPLASRLGPLAKSLAFSPDGRWLASVDQQLRWWDLAPTAHTPEDLQALVRLLVTREIDQHGSLQFLSTENLQELYDARSRSSPEDFVPDPGRTVTLSDSPR